MYHVAYDDVPTEEAIDLIETLPDGSAWAAATSPLRAWSNKRHRDADLLDAVSFLVWSLALDREKVPSPPTVTRPRDRLARAAAEQRKRAAREAVESDGWEEV